MLGPDFAEAGHAGIAAFANPLTAGLIGLSLIAGKVLSDWKKMKDAIESAPDVSGIDKVTRALGEGGLLTALLEGAAAADEFWSKLNRLANAPASIKEKTDELISGLGKDQAGSNKVLSEKEKAELAELKLAKTQGKISGSQYEIRKGEIEDRYAGQRSNNQAIEQDQVIEARKHEREVAQRIIAEGPEAIASKSNAADEAKGRLSGQKAELEEWKKKLGEITTWLSKDGPLALGSAEGRAKYGEQEKSRRLAQSEIASREMGTVPEAERAAKNTAAELAEAERRVEEAQSRRQALDREIPTLEQDRTRNRSMQQEEAVAHRRVRSAEGQGALTQEVNQGQEKQAQLEQQIIRAAHSGQGVGPAVMDALKEQERHNLEVQKELRDYSQRLRRLEGKPPPI
jgi:hypothetical protein